MPEKFKGKKTEKAGAVVEEVHLLSFVDINEAYLSATIISIDYGFGNVTDEDDIPDLEAPTEYEDQEKLSELKTSCASEAQLSNKRHEDHDRSGTSNEWK